MGDCFIYLFIYSIPELIKIPFKFRSDNAEKSGMIANFVLSLNENSANELQLQITISWECR